MIQRLFTYKQSPSTKVCIWIILIVLLCSYKNSFAQLPPPTNYPCDLRNSAGVCPVDPALDCVYPANVEKGCNCFDGIDNSITMPCKTYPLSEIELLYRIVFII